jgi:hypothetical protein
VSDPSDSDDSALEAALDAFLDWAEEQHVRVPSGGLPDAARVAEVGPGTRLGEFELVRRLDAGGMGVVFDARHVTAGNRRVAVKVLRNLFASARLEERFQREVETVEALDHEAIVPVLGAGVEGGTPYYAMQFVEGLAASRLVRALRADGEVPEQATVVRDTLARVLAAECEGPAWDCSYARWVAACGQRVAEALEYARQHAVTHRDVKPGNVMIGRDGRAVLLDFGLARRGDDDSLTASSDFVGTLAYAAPEQVRGDATDARTDVYGLGATLYELLALRRAFDAPAQAELRRRIEHEPPPPLGSWIPSELRTAVACALEKKPARRYATPGTMARDLERFLAGVPIHARPPGPARRAVALVRRYPRVSSALVVVALLVAAFVARDRQRARSQVHAGRELLAQVEVERARWSRLRDALREHGGSSALTWGERALELDVLRREAAEAREAVDRRLREAEGGLLAAFTHVSSYEPARAALVELYATELVYAFEEYADLVDRPRVQRLHDAIERFGGARTQRALLDRHGSVTLDSSPAGASFQVWGADAPEGAPALRAGTTPMRIDALAEGSYLAVLTHPRHAPTRYPFVVRRAACDALATEPGPPRELLIELLPADQVLDGFVPIAGGWTLVQDEPVRWERMPTFQMRRFELRYDEYLTWLTLHGVAADVSTSFLPRYSNLRGDEHVRWSPEAGAYVPRGETRFDWPVRGLEPTEMQEVAATYWRVSPFPSGHWYGSLPTRAEWLRAARGADARLYPWGDGFHWSHCRGHLSDPNPDREPWPAPVGLHPEDESPFLVRDLAGSLAEAVQDRFGALRDESIACGGSYRSQTPVEMRTSAARSLLNRPEADVGLRIVLRRLPEPLRAADGPPVDFADEFERPDGLDVGGGWFEAVGPLPGGLGLSAQHERCSLEHGRMLVRAEKGNNSLVSQAWHAVSLAESGWTMRVELTAHFEETDGSRAVTLELARDFTSDAQQRVSVALAGDGRMQLRSPGSAPIGCATEMRGGVPGVVEVRGRSGILEVRCWPVQRGPEGAPRLALESADPARPRFLGISAANYVGSTVAVERVVVENE